jgi:hypothetical protein
MAPRGLSTVLAMMTLYTRVARRVKGNFDIFEIAGCDVGAPSSPGGKTSKSRHQSFPIRKPIAGNMGRRLRRIETASP